MIQESISGNLIVYHHLIVLHPTHQSAHCRRLSRHIFPPPHSGTCTCSRSPTESPSTHHPALPPPLSQRGPLLRPDPPTTSSDHEQHANYFSLTFNMIVFSGKSAGIPHLNPSPPPTPLPYPCPCPVDFELWTWCRHCGFPIGLVHGGAEGFACRSWPKLVVGGSGRRRGPPWYGGGHTVDNERSIWRGEWNQSDDRHSSVGQGKQVQVPLWRRGQVRFESLWERACW